MKICPFCNAKIEENALFCIYCMTSLKEKQVVKSTKENKYRWFPVTTSILAVILIIGLFISSIYHKDDNKTVNSNTDFYSAPSNEEITSTEESSTISTVSIDDPSDIINYLTYNVYEGRGVYITDCDTLVTGDIVIPEKIDGQTVKAICNSAFKDCSGITSISLPESISIIEESAFADCSALKEINIPKGIKTLKSHTFQNCKSLISIVLPSVNSIQRYTFTNCENLKTISFYTSEKIYISDNAFLNCENITDIYYKCEKDNIHIGIFNECLQDATWHQTAE